MGGDEGEGDLMNLKIAEYWGLLESNAKLPKNTATIKRGPPAKQGKQIVTVMEGRALSRPNEFCNYLIIKRLMAPSLNPSRPGREDVLL